MKKSNGKLKKSVLIILSIAIMTVCLSQSVFALTTKSYTTQGGYTQNIWYDDQYRYHFKTAFNKNTPTNEYYVNARLDNIGIHYTDRTGNVTLKLKIYKRVYVTITGGAGYFTWSHVKTATKYFSDDIAHDMSIAYGWTKIGYYGYRIDAYANNELIGRHYRYYEYI